jgi:excisionase family DNA binding protein
MIIEENPTPAGAEPARFATTAEAAQFLGLSRAMIHKLIRSEQMPARRYGRAIRIPTAWLQAEAARSAAA